MVTGSLGLALAVLWVRLRQLTRHLKKREDQIAQMAATDSLTGLANRLELCRVGTQRLAAKPRESIILMRLDLDRFQLVNDTLGHDAGNSVLRQVGRRLQAEVKSSDVVARIGGDTFSLLLSGDLTQASHTANRLLDALHQPFYVAGHTLSISGSLGIAFTGLSTTRLGVTDAIANPVTAAIGAAASADFGQLLNQADIALSRAKLARSALPVGLLQGRETSISRALYAAGKLRLQAQYGQSRYRFFEPQMQTAIRARSHLQQALEFALINRELRVHYQSIVDLETEQIVGFEALVRWQHPDRGLMRPMEFLPLAEKTGLIVAIDRWVLEAVCRQLADWQQHPCQPPPSLSVNLSGVHLSELGLVSYVSGLLKRFQIPAQQLNLEITESVMIAKPKQAIETILALKALGLRVSLDDFGTGYSSLGYLHQLPVDVLKIDQSFVRSLGGSNHSVTLTQLNGRPDSRLIGKCPEKALRATEEISRIDYASTNRKISSSLRSDEVIIRTILVMAESLNLQVVAEGVERPDQMKLLKQMRCRYGQGHLFSEAISAQRAWALIAQDQMG